MIKELIKFTSELFPSISPYTKENVIHAIEQFDYDKLEWFMNYPIKELSQGDIIGEIPFVYFDDDGNERAFVQPSIILSNTCDVSRDKYIIIAPLFEYNNLYDKNVIKLIKSNKYYDKMCFTNSNIDDYFVDFTRAISFNRKLLLKLLRKKTSVKYSLNSYGYYLLIIKLSIYFMRPEDIDVNEYRIDKTKLPEPIC